MESFFTIATLKHYVVALVIFLIIDMLWLTVVAKDLYSKYLGYLMAPNVNFAAAAIFYLIFIVGLLFFVIDPALRMESLQYALFAGLFFGFVTYATYDLTNLATVKDWPITITIIDLIWGSALGAMTSVFSYLLLRVLNW